MKFSSLPMYVRDASLKLAQEAKQDEANYNARYFKQNGYKSFDEYHAAIMASAPTVTLMRDCIIMVMKSRYLKNGFESWMSAIPNAEMICIRYKELHMCTLAGK